KLPPYTVPASLATVPKFFSKDCGETVLASASPDKTRQVPQASDLIDGGQRDPVTSVSYRDPWMTEYALLLALVCLASAALFIGAGLELRSIWRITNTTLNSAAKGTSR